TSHDRDINASINIRNEALRILRVRNSASQAECKTHSRQELGTSDTANGGSVRRLGGKISCLLDATPNEIGSPNYNL
ncbi:MAG: hypothetical protein QNJ33_16175, partial [Crocosphaera sp.]|nr:hypothetical protein [Crocosphaera sp.]